jgi:hypothetical protein
MLMHTQQQHTGTSQQHMPASQCKPLQHINQLAEYAASIAGATSTRVMLHLPSQRSVNTSALNGC